jgi:NADH-quinone oxidoreductase subunit J
LYVSAEVVIFVLMGLTSLAGAVTVVMARNPVYSGMGLLGTMLSLAVIYVAQLAHFVAAIQIIVYAGAVMTLFLFVIMLIGVDKSEDTSEKLPRQRQIVGVLAAVTVGFAVYLGFSSGFDWVPAASGDVAAEATNGTVEAIGESLFSTWVLAFEVTALLLTVAAAGAIALAYYKRGGVDGEEA